MRVGIKEIRRWREVLKVGGKDMESFQRKGGKDEEIVKVREGNMFRLERKGGKD